VESRWVPVYGHEGRYEINEDGVIRSLQFKGKPRVPPKTISVWIRKGQGNYVTVSLSKDGVNRTRYLQQVVLESFVGPRPEGMDACHNDGNPLNNHISNLRWGTKSENQRDRLKHGTDNRGEKHHASVLTEDDVRDIRALLAFGARVTDLSRLYNVARASIQGIRNGTLWQCVN
jgi:hypothetical protein